MINSRITVLTGASRGLGRAIAERVLRQAGRQSMLCISRTIDDSLAASALEAGAALEQWSMDLVEPGPAGIKFAHWLQLVDHREVDCVTLINNAGTVAPLGPLARASEPGIARALRVGLEAPMILTGSFLRTTEFWSAKRRVLNISSSASRKPVFGQSPYCAAKAGMDHFTRVVALEEASKANGARLLSIAPGNIDTDMQGELRGSNPDDFPDQLRFLQFKAEGRLQAPAVVAEKLLQLLDHPDFGSEPVLNLRDLQ